MEDQFECLNMYFQKYEIQCEEDTSGEDEYLIEGEYLEFKEPERVKAWSFHMIPHIDLICFSYKFRSTQVFLTLLFEEKVKDVEIDTHPMLKIKCMILKPGIERSQQYHFTICLNTMLILFRMSPFLHSLEPTPYRTEIKELEAKIDRKEYQNVDGLPLNGKKLATKIRCLFNYFAQLKGKIEVRLTIQKPWTVSADLGGSDASVRNMAQASTGSQGKWKSQMPETVPAPKERRKGKGAATGGTPLEKSSEVSLVIDASIVDEMENVPHSTASERKIDYKSISEAYKRFWATCEDAYVFNVGEKVEIDIKNFIPALPTYSIRSQKSRIVQDMVNYLTNIPDKSTKQTLCVMPVGLKEKPKTWNDMENCNFYIIND